MYEDESMRDECTRDECTRDECTRDESTRDESPYVIIKWVYKCMMYFGTGSDILVT